MVTAKLVNYSLMLELLWIYSMKVIAVIVVSSFAVNCVGA